MRQNKIWAVIACAAALAACELGGTPEWPSYTVVYNANGGDGSMKNSVHKYSEKKQLNANAFTRDSYFFAGWAETPGGAVKYADRQSVKNLAKEDGATVRLYVEWKPVPVVDVPGTNLAGKLSWLQTNAQSDTNYTVEVTTGESISPATLSYGNRSNIGIILKGTDTTRIISLSSNGAMFTVNSGVTLTLDNNITLQGRSNNTATLVRVYNGRLVMNAGSAITGNTYYYSSSYSTSGYGWGGGVSVYQGTFTMSGGEISGNTAYRGGGVNMSEGTFTMSGGTISGNTATTTSSSIDSYGGGVYVGGGTITKTGGTIYGYSASDTVNSNTVKNRSSTVVSNRGHAVYASSSSSSIVKRKETTAGPSVYLRVSYNGSTTVIGGAWDY
jgi:hypothetical protein